MSRSAAVATASESVVVPAEESLAIWMSGNMPAFAIVILYRGVVEAGMPDMPPAGDELVLGASGITPVACHAIRD